VRTPGISATLVGMPPTQETQEQLGRAGDAIDRWLDALDPDDPDAADTDGDLLRDINALSIKGAPDDQLTRAVDAARECGWAWAPIAMVLGTSRRDAVRRFG
jgi:hypothetical protein